MSTDYYTSEPQCCPYHASSGFPYSPCRLPDQSAEKCAHGKLLSEACADCWNEAGTSPDRASEPAELPCPVTGCICRAGHAGRHENSGGEWIRTAEAPPPPSRSIDRIWADVDNSYACRYKNSDHMVEYILLSAHNQEVARLREALLNLADAVDHTFVENRVEEVNLRMASAAGRAALRASSKGGE